MRFEHLNPLFNRRSFIIETVVVGTGLVLGTRLAGSRRGLAEAGGRPLPGPVPTDPNAFLRIAPDDTVTVIVKHIELGQGPFTGLATLVAEELDADWSQMRAEGAPANVELYRNLFWGMVQATGASTAIANSFVQMRTVGATARAMLVTAAARWWKVPARRITVDAGVVHYRDRRATFGELAAAAMEVRPPKRVRLKQPEEFKLIGRALPKLDTVAKSNGQAEYTIDVDRPDMLTVLVEHPERFGAKVRSFDASGAEEVPGFVAAKTIPEGVAVYARGYWPAKQARERLKIEWNEVGTETRSSAEVIAAYRAKVREPGRVAAKRGTPERVDRRGPTDRTFEAEYIYPFLAHAPMEPLDCALERTADGGVQAWFGSQRPTSDLSAMAQVLGIPPEKVNIDVLFAGGSFGRRTQLDTHLAREAAEVLKAAPEGHPVKLVWTREDDIRGGYYRPIYVHRVRATVGRQGEIKAWHHRVAGQSILAGTAYEAVAVKNGIDPMSVEGAELPYAVPNFGLELHTMKVGVPVLWWRSVGSTHNGFSVETFLDELLEAGEKDPVEGRLALLEKQPRHAGVLRAVAELADWGRKPPPGRAFGVAVHKSFGTYVAQIAEVGLDANRLPKVHRVWCAVDCGVAVNPNIIAAQMEGGIGYGLGAALYGEVEMVDGRIVQKNFDDYLPLRIEDMPEVEVVVVPSTEPPTGVGEPGVPVIAPAVANAYYRVTGDRVRRLPFIRTARAGKEGVAWRG